MIIIIWINDRSGNRCNIFSCDFHDIQQRHESSKLIQKEKVIIKIEKVKVSSARKVKIGKTQKWSPHNQTKLGKLKED